MRKILSILRYVTFTLHYLYFQTNISSPLFHECLITTNFFFCCHQTFLFGDDIFLVWTHGEDKRNDFIT